MRGQANGAAAEMTGISPGAPGYRRVTLALFLAGLATFSLLYCVQPLLPLLAAGFHVSPASSSLALSLSTGVLALAILNAAPLSEAFGRRGLMAVSMLLAALLNVASAWAGSWPLLLLLRAAEGLALGGVPAVAMAYVAEEIHPDGLGLVMGLYVGGTAFGGMIGRVATGCLAEFAGWHWALAIVGLADLLAAAGFVVLLPPSRNFRPGRGLSAGHHARLWLGHLRAPGLLGLFATGFLAMGAFVTLYNYAAFRLVAPPYRLSQTGIGLIFVCYLFGIVASWAAGRLADRLPRGLVMVGGVLVSIAGVLLTLAAPLGLIIAGIALITIGFFVTHAVASGWVGRLARGAKGHAASLYLLAYYIGSSVAGSLGGWFWIAHGWDGVAGFTLALLALALAVAWLLLAGEKTRAAGEPSARSPRPSGGAASH